MYLRLDRRPQGGGREAAFISVHFGGSNIDDDFDGIVNNDVALHSFLKNLDFRLQFRIGWPLSNPLPS